MESLQLDASYVIPIITAGLGAVLALVTGMVVGKRGLFTYGVQHARVGVSADDVVFGSVRVTWNGNQVANLYSSTILLTNSSIKDYSDVTVRVFSTSTTLLTERTEIVGTTHSLHYTEEFE